VVRTELNKGNVCRAAELLGHPYIIYGIANEGTIELTNEHKLLPPDGIYRATVSRGTDSPALETLLHVDGLSLTLSERIDGELTVALHDRA
jgi:FAD synthase